MHLTPEVRAVSKASGEDIRLIRLSMFWTPMEDRDTYVGVAWLALEKWRSAGLSEQRLIRKMAWAVTLERFRDIRNDHPGQRNEKYFRPRVEHRSPQYAMKGRDKRRWPTLREVMGELSPMDQRIVEALAGGFTFEEAAELLGVGRHLIRRHLLEIRRIYCGVPAREFKDGRGRRVTVLAK